MQVRSGLEQLIKENLPRLSGKKIGLITHPAAVLPNLTHILDALLQAGVQVGALFGPEHGFFGAEADGKGVRDTVESRTSLPIYSLYGDHLAPTEDMLASLDLLIFDMQDVGVRFYTYISTLLYVLKSAAQAGLPVMVLDRPNPLRGMVGEGPPLEEDYLSFVGALSLPVLHGLTMGEMAKLIKARYHLQVDLQVIALHGWKRAMWFDQTGLPWVPTSPGMPHFSTTLLYPCTCFLEGTNISEGRGTPLPFEMVGAPFVEASTLARFLNEKDIPGVRFRAVSFVPNGSKHAGKLCHGVQLHMTDREAFRPVYSALHLIKGLMAHSAGQFGFLEDSWEGEKPHFDLLMGTDQVRNMLQQGADVEEIMADWPAYRQQFEEERAAYLLYN
jgi:uncharacterized protein YbbC (DUF1343 family)